MRLLLAGATGFVGSSIAKVLKHHNPQCHLTGLSRNSPRHDAWLFDDYIEHSLTSPLSTSKKFDVVINAAGPANYWLPEKDLRRLHIDTNRNLLQSATESSAATYIYISSASIYLQPRHVLSVKENEVPTHFFNIYGHCKWLAEQDIINSKNLPRKIILRPRMLIGAQDTSWLPELIQHIKGKWVIYPDHDILVQPTPVEILGECIAHFLRKEDLSGTFNIAPRQEVSFLRFLQMLRQIYMEISSKNISEIPLTLPSFIGRFILRSGISHKRPLADKLFNISCSLTMNCEKIYATGFSPNLRSLEEVIREYMIQSNPSTQR